MEEAADLQQQWKFQMENNFLKYRDTLLVGTR